MTKVKRIEVFNMKAIDELEMEFNGCTAIITGANNKGKTTFLRGIPDRVRGEKADIILKAGEKDGKGIIEFTNGEKFEWEFTKDGKDKLWFITKEDYKVAVTKAIAEKFFPPSFEIDEFLIAEPKKKSKMLQKLVGIDFSEIDMRYKAAYEERTVLNRLLKDEEGRLAVFNPAPEKVEIVNVETLMQEKSEIKVKLNTKYLENKAHNDNLRKEYEAHKEKVQQDVAAFNREQDNRATAKSFAFKALEELKGMGYKGNEVKEWIDSLPIPEQVKDWKNEINPEPTYITERPDDAEITAIDAKIAEASNVNRMAQQYSDYLKQGAAVKTARAKAESADMKVKSIEQEKAQMVANAKLPEGLSFSDDGILVDGLPLDKNQLSTSKIYTTALRLASLNLGVVKTLYFDASPLDRNTLLEVEKWATEHELQLLIERPDYEGGDIKYELIDLSKA